MCFELVDFKNLNPISPEKFQHLELCYNISKFNLGDTLQADNKEEYQIKKILIKSNPKSNNYYLKIIKQFQLQKI